MTESNLQPSWPSYQLHSMYCPHKWKACHSIGGIAVQEKKKKLPLYLFECDRLNYMPDLYFLWVRMAYLYACINSGPYHASKWSLAALWGKYLLILTSLCRKSRKGWCYIVVDRDLVKGCQTRSFFEGSKRPPAFTFRSMTFNNLKIAWICRGCR